MSPWRVTSVRALPEAQLEVTFVDGTSGKVDMRAFLSSSKVDGTVFEALRDPAVFAEARVVMVRFSGRTAPISRRTRCTTQFAKAASGFWPN